MNITCYTGGIVETNGYVIELNDDIIVIDAPKGMAEFLKSKSLVPTLLLITHQHFDHIEDARLVQEMGEVKTYAMETYNEDLSLTKTAQSWGMTLGDLIFRVDEQVKEGDVIEAKELSLDVLHVPGHSPESLVFYLKAHGVVFTGDTLFSGGMGRFDFDYGDGELLKKGIQEKILTLPPETLSLSGHGPQTTIEAELANNPYFS